MDLLRGFWVCWETFIKYFLLINNPFMSFLAPEGSFVASNSLQNIRGQKWSCPCYLARHLQQIHWSKLLCGMYGLTAKLSVARLNICQILMRCICRRKTTFTSFVETDDWQTGENEISMVQLLHGVRGQIGWKRVYFGLGF